MKGWNDLMQGFFRKGRILILLLIASFLLICVSAIGEDDSGEPAVNSFESVSIRDLAVI